jgi:hypothetical protein
LYEWQYYQAVYCVGVLHQTDNQCINNAWTVYYPNGVNKKFTSANNYNNKILNWNLVTTKDKFNNTIDYNYTVDNNIYKF